MNDADVYWAKRGRLKITNGLSDLQRSLQDVPTEVEDPEAIMVQNAVDLVETALYWLKGLDNNEV